MTNGSIRWIFWDNDGVLVDTEPLFYRATKSVFADCGMELTDELFQRWFLSDSRGAWHLLPQQHSNQEAVLLHKRERDQRYSRLLGEPGLKLVHVERTLEALHGRARMAVVTSSKAEHFEIIHRQTGYLSHFDFVLTREAYSRSKPAPDPYLAALKRAGAAPDEVLVIEDSERGLRAAAAAGLRCWVLPSALTRGCCFEGADRILSSIEDVLEAFEEN